jgi:aspartate/methionine/tyrosine aminotransferase
VVGLSGLVSDWVFKKKLERCFKRLKREQLRVVDFPRFYLVTKCPELAELSDWKLAAYLFHLHHASVGPGDHLVVHFLRWLRG